MKIGRKIRDSREDLDLSQKEVASRIPMNQSNYSKIERDLQEPNLEQLKRICEILHLDPAYLLEIAQQPRFSGTDARLLADIKHLVDTYKDIL